MKDVNPLSVDARTPSAPALVVRPVVKSSRVARLGLLSFVAALAACGAGTSDSNTSAPADGGDVVGDDGGSPGAGDGGVGCPGVAPKAFAEEAALRSAPLELTAWTARAGDSPGGKATLEQSTENGASGIRLSYDTCNAAAECSSYAVATWKSEETGPAGSVRFRARTRDHGNLFVRVVDGEGQTFQYSPWRPPESNEGDLASYRVVLADADREPGFPYATFHYGGANDGVFRGGVTSVSIGYGTFFGRDLTGDLFFTDVAIASPETYPVDTSVDVAGSEFHLAQGAAGDGKTELGISFFMHGSAATQIARLTRVKELGFHYVRVDAGWGKYEKVAGQYDLSELTALKERTDALGLGLQLILDYGNALYSGTGDTKTGPATAAYRAAYVAYAKKVVEATRAPNVHYEIWNEPNGPSFWKPEPSPADYGLLCRDTVVAVKPLLLPGEHIIAGNLANGSLSFGFQRGFEASGGCLADTTAGVPTWFGYHPYRSTQETWGQTLNQWRTQIPGIEVINGEWGMSSSSPRNALSATVDGRSVAARRRQAVEASRRFLMEAALQPARSTHYSLIDLGSNGDEKEQNYGLLDLDGVMKPAGVAARLVLDLSKRAHFDGWTNAADGRVHAARFTEPGKMTLVLWTDAYSKDESRQPSFRTHVRCDGMQASQDVVGDPIEIQRADGACSVVLTENAGPVFLTYAPCDPTAQK